VQQCHKYWVEEHGGEGRETTGREAGPLFIQRRQLKYVWYKEPATGVRQHAARWACSTPMSRAQLDGATVRSQHMTGCAGFSCCPGPCLSAFSGMYMAQVESRVCMLKHALEVGEVAGEVRLPRGS
jgi:hypothetical protein